MMHENPWKVESIQAFSCLKCPECTYFTKKENNFENHALRNHPLSKVLFDKPIYPTGSFQDYDMKEEIQNDMNHVSIKEEPTELSDYEKDPLNFCETTIHQGKEIWTDNYNDQAEGEIIYPHGYPGRSLMGNDIGSGLSFRAVCFYLRSNNVGSSVTGTGCTTGFHVITR